MPSTGCQCDREDFGCRGNSRKPPTPRTAERLAAVVRIMHIYYSNLLEAHDTRPREIERALAGKWAPDHLIIGLSFYSGFGRHTRSGRTVRPSAPKTRR